jgi:septal ring factor EnvC (AmiA/AmiB activator)
MRTCPWLIAALLLVAGVARAEETPNPDQLKRAYEDALVQLRAAQDSKSALANDNEKLLKQVDDLKKQLADAQGQIENLKRQVSDNDQKTFAMRSYQAAWRNFLKARPDLLVSWRLFLGEDALAVPQERLQFMGPGWPLLDNSDPSGRGFEP